MNDAKRPKTKRAASTAKPAAARSRRYIALHENKLSLCLAGGFISPWPKGAAVQDHHDVAGRLVIEADIPSASSVQAARGGLTYGSVVILEVDIDAVANVVLDQECVTVLPLQAATRALFPTEAALEEFAARISGYGDIAANLVPLAVDPAMFPRHAGTEVAPELPLQDPVSSSQAIDATVPCVPNVPKESVSSLDRDAGSLATAMWALAATNRPELVYALSGLVPVMNSGEGNERMPVVLATLLDQGEAAPTAATVLREVVRVVAGAPSGDGVDAIDVLRQVRAALEANDGRVPEIVSKFLSHSEEIAASRRDISPNAFLDEDGSITLRAILLFLLNPDSDRLGAIQVRTRNLGPRVYCLAASLIGLHSGFASLGAELKGSAARTTAVPRLVLEAFLGKASDACVTRAWHVEEGYCDTTLSWRGADLANVREPADPVLHDVAILARGLGRPARFDGATGQLSIVRSATNPMRAIVVSRRDVLPVFPRSRGLELVLDTDERLSKKSVAARVAQLNGEAIRTGIFASDVPDKRSSILRLHAFVSAPASAEAIKEALNELEVAQTFRSPDAPVKERPSRAARPDVEAGGSGSSAT